MADITILISYDPNATPPADKITVSLEPHIDFGTARTIHWQLNTNAVPPGTALAFIDNWHPDNPLDPPAVYPDFTGTDNNDNDTASEQVFTYDIFLLVNGVPVAKDPEIVNDPGGGHFQLFHSPKT
jgi:hypothetical protein